ncbi:Nme7 [Symbiodinium sp. KB8]|nr:Nme7 [Symbiodinium sp. KB8]
MYDPKARKTFLKRCQPTEDVVLQDLAVGGRVTIMSRPLAVVRYLDQATQERFKVTTTTTLCLVKPDVYNRAGDIVDSIQAEGLTVSRCRLVQLSRAEAEEFLAPRRKNRAFAAAFADHAKLLCADAVLALEVKGNDSVSSMHLLAGPAQPHDALQAAPASIRARWGTDAIMNAVHVSASRDDADRELEFMFSDARRDAADYLAAYKGVVPEYSGWVQQLSAGACVILQVRGEDIIPRVRELVGPYDPQIAKALRPDSLRARFGVDSIRNAVHCTDLEDDGPLESQFLFETVLG